jgi:hypothetical protein
MARNSCRVSGLSRKLPSIRLVTRSVPCLCTPRIDRHAVVLRLDDHAHALGLQHLLNRVGHLRRQALLDLQALGVSFHYPGEFRDAHHPAIWDVGDSGAADDRRHVVLAVAEEWNATQDDHLVVAIDLLERSLQNLLGILAVARKVLAIRAQDPIRRIAQSVASRLLAHPTEHGADRLAHLIVPRRSVRLATLGGRRASARERHHVVHAIGSMSRWTPDASDIP